MSRLKEVYRGQIVTFQLQETILPNGATATIEMVRHSGAAATVPIDDTGHVILVRQFRPVVGEFLLELPAGKLDPGEDPLETARRELREEVGLDAGEMVPLGTVLTAPGYSDERVSLYLARRLVVRNISLDPGEVISSERMPFTEAVKLVYEGQIRDSKTIVGLFLAQRHLNVLT